jgi:hypothetical protein
MSPWVRLDDTFDDDPSVVTAGPAPTGLLVALLCWNNRTLSDGFVPAAVARQKAGGDRELVNSLLTAGLLSEVVRDKVKGFAIRADLVALQPSRERVEARRALTRVRKERFLERNVERIAERTAERRWNADGVTIDSRSVAEGTPAPIPVPIPVPLPGPSPESAPEACPAPLTLPEIGNRHGRREGKEEPEKPSEGNLEEAGDRRPMWVQEVARRRKEGAGQ